MVRRPRLDAAPAPDGVGGGRAARVARRAAGGSRGRAGTPRPHQGGLGEAGRSALLVAPTGGGKTLAGFLPSLIELAERGGGRAAAGVPAPPVSPPKGAGGG